MWKQTLWRSSLTGDMFSCFTDPSYSSIELKNKTKSREMLVSYSLDTLMKLDRY